MFKRYRLYFEIYTVLRIIDNENFRKKSIARQTVP